MHHQTSSMVTPFAPAMAGWTARCMSRRVRVAEVGDPGVMQILAGKKQTPYSSIHIQSVRVGVLVATPHPMLTDGCNDLRVASMLILPYSTLQWESLT
jgi:hypothetical protein